MGREIWKDVVGYEGLYQVSTFGRVKSLDRVCIFQSKRHGRVVRIIKGRILKLSPTTSKTSPTCVYLNVSLSKNGVLKTYSVHKLVLEAFVGPRPGGMEACHFPDRDGRNNHVGNLRWASPSENVNDSIIHGTKKFGDDHVRTKIPDKDIPTIRKNIKAGIWNKKQVARKFDVSEGHIGNIVRGKKRKER